MRRRGLALLAGVVLLGVVGCGDDDEGGRSGGGDGGGERAEESTSTTVDPADAERPRVVEAREAAHQARIQALGAPQTNPTLPALAQTHTGAAEEWVFATAEIMGHNGFIWRQAGQSRLEVRSVTFPDGPTAGVAFVESCEIDDHDRTVRDGSPALNDPDLDYGVLDDLPVTAILRADVMRQVDGAWKLEETIAVQVAENATDCAGTSRPVDDVDPEVDQRAATEAREAAERAWIDALINPAAPPPTDTYTGWGLRWFGPDYSPGSLVDHCPPSSRRPETGPDDPCLRVWWVGVSGPSFVVRSDGAAFSPDSSSQVTVSRVVFEDNDQNEAPDVAYLRTCRTHRLARADGLQMADPAATITAWDAMRWEDGRWKLAARWGFTVQPLEAGCS